MKTSFKKAMKCFFKKVPGILYLTQKGYLFGGLARRVMSRGSFREFMSGGGGGFLS